VCPFGHVATQQSDTDQATLLAPGPGEDTLIEGVAEYCAYTGHPGSWAGPRLANVRQYAREGRWGGQAFMAGITGGSPLDDSAAYGIGYLTIRRLVQRFGLHHTLEF
jgi:hypothetical protein